jgi:hypothetical protein
MSDVVQDPCTLQPIVMLNPSAVLRACSVKHLAVYQCINQEMFRCAQHDKAMAELHGAFLPKMVKQ